eukprot:6253423-Pyramimonas_sp.AAC.1
MTIRMPSGCWLPVVVRTNVVCPIAAVAHLAGAERTWWMPAVGVGPERWVALGRCSTGCPCRRCRPRGRCRRQAL